jgi:purine-binding chemotaxis protein CheW
VRGGETVQIVVFKLNDEEFAVETAKVQGINDIMEITRVPKAPAYIKGLINLRGNIISLLDINLLLDTKKKDSDQSNIIILNMKEEVAGISVDEVNEVIDIEENMIERIEDDKKKACIKGVINFQDRIVTLIDVDKLINN